MFFVTSVPQINVSSCNSITLAGPDQSDFVLSGLVSWLLPPVFLTNWYLPSKTGHYKS